VLLDVVQETMALYFQKPSNPQVSYQRLAKKHPLPPTLRRPAGVFVTLSQNGKPRACWGSLYAEQRDVVQSTIYTTIGALSKEYRYAPIRSSELKALKPQVTLVRKIEPLRSISSLNPLQDGLMVRSGAKSAIILPGEARDAYYQMIQGKVKAGIQPGEPFQMYRIKADVYK
jgi:AMMECR1 domain-containing protein